MNNPMQQVNFMSRGSPPAAGGPIAKKQRGGRTPASIRHATAPPRGRSGGPPIRPPPTDSSSASVGVVVDDAIARRRAELRRLQEKAKRSRAAARKQDTEDTVSSDEKPPPQVPPMRPVGVGRHSDLFPSVQPKSPSLEKDTLDNEMSRIEAFAKAASETLSTTILEEDDDDDGNPNTTTKATEGQPPKRRPPPMSISSMGGGSDGISNRTGNNPNLPPETPLGNVVPPTPAVGRRLEFPSSQKPPTGAAVPPSKSSSTGPPPPTSSAPGRPPMGKPPLMFGGDGGGPPTFTTAATTTTGPPPTSMRSGTPSVRRARSKSPTPTPRASLKTKEKAAAALAERRRKQRAVSAPPSRPPPPSGPPPGGGGGGAKAVAQKKIKGRRPPPVIPGSLLGGAKPKTTETEAETTTMKAPPESTVEPGESAKGPPHSTTTAETKAPPPTRVSSTASSDYYTDHKTTDDDAAPPASEDVGLGTMDTSKIPPPLGEGGPTTAAATTPILQRETFLDDGQKTPPSTGSSARRQKMQLMRDQAIAAADFNVSSGGSGPPATAAFAAAIGATGAKDTSGPPKTLHTAPDLGKGPPKPIGLAPPGKNVSLAPRGADLPPFGKVSRSSSITSGTDSGSNADVDDPTDTDIGAPTPLRSKSQSRLEEAYQKSERAKAAAFAKIKELEEKLNQRAKEDIDHVKRYHQPLLVGGLDTIVDELLEINKKDGPDAAFTWIESMKGQFAATSSPPVQQPPGTPTTKHTASRVGFATGMGTLDGSNHSSGMLDTPTRRKISSRTLTPHPAKRRPPPSQDGGPYAASSLNEIEETPVEMERRLIHQFREAAQYVPFEFSSESADFTVRRPYGIDLTSNTELFEYVKPHEQPLDAYSKKAHVSAKSSVEVVAIIKADNSPLLLFDTAGVRYKTNPNASEWTHIDNVDSMDRPVGHVTYIDEHAMEREYSLDEILEEALLVREQYCGTLTSTALGLEGRGPMMQAQQPPLQEQQIPSIEKKSSRDVAVETDERGIGADATAPQNSQQTPSAEKIPAAEDDDGYSSDVLIVFLGMMFTFVFKLFFGIVIGIPLRVIRAIVVFTISYVIIQMIYMHYVDGYNEWLLRLYNDPAIPNVSYKLTDIVYYTNRAPGIM